MHNIHHSTLNNKNYRSYIAFIRQATYQKPVELYHILPTKKVLVLHKLYIIVSVKIKIAINTSLSRCTHALVTYHYLHLMTKFTTTIKTEKTLTNNEKTSNKHEIHSYQAR